MSASAQASLPDELVARVRDWLAEDPDPGSRAELDALVGQADEAALRDRFDHPLTFGTAGLRGPLGAGPGRMNRAVVRKTTAALAEYVLRQQATSGRERPAVQDEGERRAVQDEGERRAVQDETVPLGIVIGHDARHRSADFAEDAARVVAARGLRAWWFRSALPTPITAFAVRHFAAAAGVVITASHNPAPDNGYKVYLADGAQIVQPHDAAIAATAATTVVPSDAALSGPLAGNLVEVDEAEVLEAYRRAVLPLVDPDGPRGLRILYTPVHGVGGAVLPGLLEQAGFDRPELVAAQAEPDPDFPTAPFPNPEEPGVLDRALAQAERTKVDIVLANDPDADRLAVAVPGPKGQGFKVLSGDELGILIADHLIAATTGSDRLVATTVVSSSMLSALAESAGVAYVETLTGFKWIARAAQRRPGHRLLFGYEEALGYAVSAAVADKDGLSAALVVAEIAARARHDGRSLLQRLDELETGLGVHATAQCSLRLPGSRASETMSLLMARLRSAPLEALGGLKVTKVRDLAKGEGALPPSDLLVLELGDEGRVVFRPSGTEPKLKVYLEARSGPLAPEELAGTRRAAQARLGELRKDVMGRVGAP